MQRRAPQPRTRLRRGRLLQPHSGSHNPVQVRQPPVPCRNARRVTGQKASRGGARRLPGGAGTPAPQQAKVEGIQPERASRQTHIRAVGAAIRAGWAGTRAGYRSPGRSKRDGAPSQCTRRLRRRLGRPSGQRCPACGRPLDDRRNARSLRESGSKGWRFFRQGGGRGSRMTQEMSVSWADFR